MRRLLILLFAIVMLGGCAAHKVDNLLTTTLDSYGATIRWGSFDAALQYVDPAVLAKHPPSALDLARYQQVRVSQYDDDGPVRVSPTEAHQRVVIGLINRHTQSERSIVDNQVWKFDAAKQRWWLESGLPKIVE